MKEADRPAAPRYKAGLFPLPLTAIILAGGKSTRMGPVLPLRSWRR
jgi:hypothetical protein